MDVPADTVRRVIDCVDTVCAFLDAQDISIMTVNEQDACKLLPSLMDELQRYLDANPPWRR